MEVPYDFVDMDCVDVGRVDLVELLLGFILGGSEIVCDLFLVRLTTSFLSDNVLLLPDTTGN